MTYTPPGLVARVFLLVLLQICNSFVLHNSLNRVCDTRLGTGIRHSVGAASVGVPSINRMMDVQMTDISRDRQPTLIVGHNEG